MRAVLVAAVLALALSGQAFAGGHRGHGGHGYHSRGHYGRYGGHYGHYGHRSQVSFGIGIGLGGWGCYPGSWRGCYAPYWAPSVVYAPPVVCAPAAPVVVERTVIVNNYCSNDHWKPKFSAPQR